MPVLGNLFGNQQRVLAALELENREGLRELGQEFAFLRNPSLPESRQTILDRRYCPGTGYLKCCITTPSHGCYWSVPQPTVGRVSVNAQTPNRQPGCPKRSAGITILIPKLIGPPELHHHD